MELKQTSGRLVRQLRNGQITLPAEFRRQLGISSTTLLLLTLDRGEIRIRPLGQAAGGAPWFEQLYTMFAPARQEAIDEGLNETEINDAIDRAVKAVREGAKHKARD